MARLRAASSTISVGIRLRIMRRGFLITSPVLMSSTDPCGLEPIRNVLLSEYIWTTEERSAEPPVPVQLSVRTRTFPTTEKGVCIIRERRRTYLGCGVWMTCGCVSCFWFRSSWLSHAHALTTTQHNLRPSPAAATFVVKGSISTRAF